jgi:hypothetical protein
MLLVAGEAELLQRYQVGCVFFAGSDVGWLGTTSRDALDAVPTLRPGYADAYARVYLLSAPSTP